MPIIKRISIISTMIFGVYQLRIVCWFFLLPFLFSSCTSPIYGQGQDIELPQFTATNAIPTRIAPSSTTSPTEETSDTSKTSIPTHSQNNRQEETIPSCLNSDSPYPIRDFNKFQGVVLYSNEDRDQWFTFQSNFQKVEEVDMPAMKVNSVALPNLGPIFLAYNDVPEKLDISRAVFLLKSEAGSARAVEIDMKEMEKYYENVLGAGVAPFHTWSFRWITDSIVLIDATFSETVTSSFPYHQYRLYDVADFAWRDDLTQELPQRELYQWFDISQDLARILYLDQQYNLLLWDRDQQKILWSDRVSPSIVLSPLDSAWSPDSRYIAFGWGFYVKILSRDGEALQIVPYPTFENSTEKYMNSQSFRWSPDSSMLAISGVVNNDQDQPTRSMLYLYDVEKQKYVYRCPFQKPITELSIPETEITWSTDGRFILPRNPEGATVPLRLFDLKNMSVYQISDKQERVLGWFDQFPENWR